MVGRTRRLPGIAAALYLFTLTPPAAALDITEQNPVRKLGRGVANILGSALEIPIAIEEAYRLDGFLAGVTMGTVYGLVSTGVRAGVGTFEVATFPAPLPGVGYGPIVLPEFRLHPDDQNQMSLVLTEAKFGAP